MNPVGKRRKHVVIWEIAERMKGQVICPNDIAKQMNLVPVQITKIMMQKYELKAIRKKCTTKPKEYQIIGPLKI